MAPRLSTPDPPERREAILRAAIDILQHHGAGALTVRSVANAAGCSTTGVYTWFGSKNGLVEAIFVDGFRSFHAAQQEVLDTAADLTALAVAYRRWALDHPTHYQVMFQRAVPDFEPSDAAREVAWSTFAQLLVAADEARRTNRINEPVADLAHHMWATVHGYVSLEISGMSPHDAATNARLFDEGVAHAQRSFELVSAKNSR
jgi:AcrR family transcriptional regulator